MAEYNQKEIEQSMDYIRSHNKLVLYGTGNDCLGLLMLIDENTKGRLLYSDKKAEKKSYTFQNKNVIAPKELCSVYKDYDILVTSSLYSLNIEYEFKKLGIEPFRVYYNRAQFQEENK